MGKPTYTLSLVTSAEGESLPGSTVPTLILSQEVICIGSAHSSLANMGHQELPDFRGSGITTPVCAQRQTAHSN